MMMSLTCKAEEIMFVLKATSIGFPWWPGGKEAACQHSRHRFEPWRRKMPRAAEPLSLCIPTTELVL